MIRLVSELTDTELLHRLHKLENYQIQITELLSMNPTPYKKALLHKKYDIALIHYVHALNEAAYRNLITIH